MCHFYACFWFRKQRGNLCFWQVIEIRNCTSTVVSDTVLRHARYSVDDLQLTLCFPVRRQPLKHHCPECFCFFWSCRLHQVTLEFHEMKWKTVNAIFLHAVILFHPTQCLAMTFFFFCQVCPFKSPNVVDALSLWNDTHTEEGRETHQ